MKRSRMFSGQLMFVLEDNSKIGVGIAIVERVVSADLGPTMLYAKYSAS